MPLIKVYWHFNCWRPIFIPEESKSAEDRGVEVLHLTFLVVRNPSSTTAGPDACDRQGFPTDGANTSNNCFLLEAHSFFRSSKEALSISHVIADTATSFPDHLYLTHIPVLLSCFRMPVLLFCFFSLQDKYVLVFATLWMQASKQASKKTLQNFLHTQQAPFPWPCHFEPYIMAVCNSFSSTYFFRTSWSISLYWHAS